MHASCKPVDGYYWDIINVFPQKHDARLKPHSREFLRFDGSL